MKKNFLYAIAGLLILLAGCGQGADDVSSAKNNDDRVREQDTKQDEETEAEAKKKEESHFYDKYFTVGEHEGEKMEPQLDPLRKTLADKAEAKMQKGIQDNQEWFKKALEGLEPGEQLPYDKRLGVTEEEYNLIVTIDDHINLRKTADYPVNISKNQDVLMIDIKDSPVIKEINISNDGEKLETDKGEFSKIDEIAATDSQKATGPWNGYVYQNDKKQEIDFGQLEDSKQILIRTRMSAKEQELIYLDAPKNDD